MNGLGELAAIVAATAAEALERATGLGNWGTSGPDVDAHPDVDPWHASAMHWSSGWWSFANRAPVHPGRVGPMIRPCCTVVHTTDMLPEEWPALLKRWYESPGDGACAHFGIGRSSAEGCVQWVPIMRNGNHAGGGGHGVFMTAAAATTPIHPNTIAVGIEVHCAGGVHLVDGEWRLVENHKAHGSPLPAADVIPDPIRPGLGWHVVTDYQRKMLTQLLQDLELVLAPMPAGLVARSTGEAVPSWGVPKSARVVGHVSLDPTHRSDPWPPQMQFLNAR